jgi:hypothetical protein
MVRRKHQRLVKMSCVVSSIHRDSAESSSHSDPPFLLIRQDALTITLLRLIIQLAPSFGLFVLHVRIIHAWIMGRFLASWSVRACFASVSSDCLSGDLLSGPLPPCLHLICICSGRKIRQPRWTSHRHATTSTSRSTRSGPLSPFLHLIFISS